MPKLVGFWFLAWLLSQAVSRVENHMNLAPSIPLNPSKNLTRETPLNTNATTPIVERPSQGTNKSAEEDCTKRKLTPALWVDLNMNNYLQQYPQGNYLSLKAYSNLVGASNFNLNIGSHCRMSQLCNGVEGKAWYALVAAQRWNVRMNQAYDAVAFASTVAMEITQAMTFDFIPAPTHAWLYASTIISATFWTILAIPSIWFGPVGKYYYRGLLSVFYATTAAIRPLSTLKHPTFSRAFAKWNELDQLMIRIKKDIQTALVNLTQQVKDSGISTERGLYGLNTQGELFSQTSRVSESEMQEGFEEVYKLQCLSHIWRAQNVFIVRGGEPCNGKGENGAKTGKDVISFCGTDGIMMNLVHVKRKKLKSNVFGADLAVSKYKFTPENLTSGAWKCQKLLGRVVEPTTWQAATETENTTLLSVDCKFTLPVCDLTRKDIKDAVDSGSSIIKACKNIGKLPI